MEGSVSKEFQYLSESDQMEAANYLESMVADAEIGADQIDFQPDEFKEDWIEEGGDEGIN